MEIFHGILNDLPSGWLIGKHWFDAVNMGKVGENGISHGDTEGKSSTHGGLLGF